MPGPHRIGYEIRAVSNLLKRKVFEMNVADGETLTEMQMHIIGYLFEHQGEELFQRDLEDELIVRRSSVSRFLVSMEQQGLLVRQPVPQDARLKKLILTPKGIAKHEQGMRRLDQVEATITRGLSQAEQAELSRLFGKIKQSLS